MKSKPGTAVCPRCRRHFTHMGIVRHMKGCKMKSKEPITAEMQAAIRAAAAALPASPRAVALREAGFILHPSSTTANQGARTVALREAFENIMTHCRAYLEGVQRANEAAHLVRNNLQRIDDMLADTSHISRRRK